MTTALALSTDRGFLGPTSCVLTALARVKASSPVYILHDDVPAELRALTQSTVARELSVEWIDVTRYLPRNLATLPHVTRICFARLLLADLLPADISAIGFLDGDIHVRTNPDELLRQPLGQHPLAACVDLTAPRVDQGVPSWRAFDLDPASRYFNAGVHVLNAPFWRSERLGPRLIQFARDNPHLPSADQDVLNINFVGQWLQLHPRWNLLWGGYGRRPDFKRLRGLFPTGQLDDALRDPAIVHFAGSIKPWSPRFGNRFNMPWFDDWSADAAQSPFRDELMDDRLNRITRLLWSPVAQSLDAGFRWSRRLKDGAAP